MDSTDKSSSGLERAIVVAGSTLRDGANTPNNTGSTRSIALLDMNQPADPEDEDGLPVDVVEAEGGGSGSSSQRRNYGRLSQEQLDQLEAMFQQNQWPDRKTKQELADKIGMPLSKVHIWFRSRRTRFNEIQRDLDHKQQVNKLIDEIDSLTKQNSSLTKQNASLTKKIMSLTEKVSSLAQKSISLYEKNSSLTEEKRQLERELSEIKVAPAPPPMMLPVHGLPQVFVELCRVCSTIFRDTAAAAGALPGSQKGSASASRSASTSTAKPCPDCLNTLENMEAMVASVAQRQRGSAAAAAATLMPPSSSSGARGSA